MKPAINFPGTLSTSTGEENEPMNDTKPNPTLKSEYATHPQKGGAPISKVKHYNWKLKNTEGEFASIHKSELIVDSAYQRLPRSQEAVLKIARDWNWIANGTITVVSRSGKWYVVDGQHRLAAAMLRADIQFLPCMVFEADDETKKEAEAFLAINTCRNLVGSSDRFKAGVTSDDPSCVWLNSKLKESGLQSGPCGSSKTVACVGILMKLARDNQERLNTIWPLILKMHDGIQIYGDVVKGLWSIEQQREERNKSLSHDPDFSKLVRIGGAACIAEIRRLSIQRGVGGAAVFRDAILTLLRKKI